MGSSAGKSLVEYAGTAFIAIALVIMGFYLLLPCLETILANLRGLIPLF